jgi:uncharacterized protein (DUF885 family)
VTSDQVTSELDEIGEGYVRSWAALDPSAAVRLGVGTAFGELTNYGPDAFAARAELARATLAAASRATGQIPRDRSASRAMVSRLGSELELFEAGEWLREVRAIGSPLGEMREVFDLLPRATDDDWADVLARLQRVPDVIESYRRTLQLGIDRGVVTSKRQALVLAAQARTFSGATLSGAHGPGFFARLAASCTTTSAPLAEQLVSAAVSADGATGQLGEFFRSEYAPAASDADGVGRESYELWSRHLNGITLDLDETYHWGWADLRAIMAEMDRVADEIAPGGGLRDVVAQLESDPSRVVHGEDNLRRFLQHTMDAAIDTLAGTHFDIAEPVRRIEACIAPPGGAAAMYYTPPSEDFSRPGRTWYPTLGRQQFPLWLEVTTAYHEGVPGHHLELGQTCWLGNRLNPFLRGAGRVSGHVEGWAVYAERLMDELGLIEDPAYRLGMLACQAFRAARVVVDIGLHLGLRIPEEWGELGGERWDAGAAVAILHSAVFRPEDFLRSEVDRYLGWPSQAIGYKVGERIWHETREIVRQRTGARFDLKAFHARAFELGLVGLEQLRDEMGVRSDVGNEWERGEDDG